MAIATRPFDAANYMDSAADQADLLSHALDRGDPRIIAYALGAVARARGALRSSSGQAGGGFRAEPAKAAQGAEREGQPDAGDGADGAGAALADRAKTQLRRPGTSSHQTDSTVPAVNGRSAGKSRLPPVEASQSMGLG